MDAKFKVITDIIRHASEVHENLSQVSNDLERRGIAHDRSKLEAIEFDGFVKTRSRFEKVNYGSEEYRECAKAIQPSIDHHYQNNRHHAKHFENGFADMNLLDILEMIADWKAASRRSPDLLFEDSLSRAFDMYKIPKNMQRHIILTLDYLGWIDAKLYAVIE